MASVDTSVAGCQQHMGEAGSHPVRADEAAPASGHHGQPPRAPPMRRRTSRGYPAVATRVRSVSPADGCRGPTSENRIAAGPGWWM